MEAASGAVFGLPLPAAAESEARGCGAALFGLFDEFAAAGAPAATPPEGLRATSATCWVAAIMVRSRPVTVRDIWPGVPEASCCVVRPAWLSGLSGRFAGDGLRGGIGLTLREGRPAALSRKSRPHRELGICRKRARRENSHRAMEVWKRFVTAAWFVKKRREGGAHPHQVPLYF